MSKKKKNKNKKISQKTNISKNQSEMPSSNMASLEEKTQVKESSDTKKISTAEKKSNKDQQPSSFQRYIQSIKDSIDLEKETMSEMNSFKQKAGYILYYHKWQFLVIFLCLFTLIYTAHTMLTHKDYAFNCVVINNPNTNETFDTALIQQMEKSIKYNKKKEKVDVTDFTTVIEGCKPGYYGADSGSQGVFSQMSMQQIDTMIAEPDIMEWFSKDDNFCNLEKVLPSDLYKTVEPYIVSLPDKSGNRYAYALNISKTKCYKEGDCGLSYPYIGIFANTKHLDEAIAFIQQIFEE